MQTAEGKSRLQIDEGAAAGLLDLYRRAASESEATEILNRLFEIYLGPWSTEAARRTLRCHGLYGSDNADEEAEVVAEVMLQMTRRLRGIRTGGVHPVENLRGYLTTSVRHACLARIRARCPRHMQLRNRVQYLLRNDRDFALWGSSGGESLAGLRTWSGREDRVAPETPARLGKPISAASIKELLDQIFASTGGPVSTDDLVAAVAASAGIREEPVLELEAGVDFAADEAPADLVMIDRQRLGSLWHEVVQLPPNQSAALLLNLRDAEGQGVIELIPATGTASFEALAAAVNLAPAELARLWPDLPLDDARIAAMLGLTRQQVINLRKSARDRIGRRLRKANGNMATNPPSTLERAGRKIRSILGRGREA